MGILGKEVSSINQNVRVGVLQDDGDGLATYLLGSMGFAPKFQAELQSFRAPGSKFPSLVTVGREWATAEVSGRAAYDELPFAFMGVMGNYTYTSLSTDAKQHEFTLRNRQADDVYGLCLDRGSDRYWLNSPFALFNAFALRCSRAGVEIGGELLAKSLTDTYGSTASALYNVALPLETTAGTYTITFGGQTTAAIAFSADGPTIQAALELLSTVGAGNVYVEKVDEFEFNIYFINDLADATKGAVTASGAALDPAGTITVAQDRTGKPLTELPLVPVLPTELDVRVADTYAALGGKDPMDREFTFNWELGNRFGPVWPLRSIYKSFANAIETEPSLKVTMRVSADDVGREFIRYMKNGRTKFIRLTATGDALDANNNYYLQIDTACKVVQAPGGPEDSDGLDTFEWTFGGVQDPGFGSGGGIAYVKIVNATAEITAVV